MQVKDRAKPGLITDGGPVLNDLWIGSRWTIFNNKGKPVRRFEPFFDHTHHFKNDMKICVLCVSPTTFYDPIGRLVAVLRQDHAIEKTILTPWPQVLFGVNDNVALLDPRTDPDIGHFFTSLPFHPSMMPKSMAVSDQTRTFLAVEDNGTEKLANFMILDIMGNAKATRDAL